MQELDPEMLRQGHGVLVSIPRRGGTLLYCPETMAMVVVGEITNELTWGVSRSVPLDPDLTWHRGRLLLAPGGNQHPLLGMLDEPELQGRGLDNLPPTPPKNDASVDFVVFLTDECNCRCRYCYLPKADPGTASAFTPERVDEAVSFLRARSSPEAALRVTFHGGEPLTRFAVLRRFVEEACVLRDCFSDVSFRLYTNGTLVTEEIARFLDSHRFEVEVSADGAQDAHDQYRVSAAGRPTYRAMAEGARRLLDKPGLRVSASSVVTRRNLDLVGIVEHLRDIGFEHVILRYAGGPPYEPTREDLPAVAAAEDKLAAYLAATLAGGRGPKVSPHLETLEAMLNGEPIFYACSAGRSAFFAGGDGAVYPCLESSWYPAWKLGTLADGLQGMTRDSGFAGRVTGIVECSGCWARFICGGPCPARSLRDGLDHKTPSPLMCARTKIFCAALLDLAADLADLEEN